MGWKRDHSPVPNTCPKIDEVIDILMVCEFPDDGWHTLKDAISIMEEIRSANSTLRDWGNDLCDIKDELEDEINDLRKEVSKLEEDVDYYSRQLNQTA